ncbi:hypothetical protein FW774_07665 [Pedobacter sp. BS3]|uniref:hypothetical protein n=1 Tax=Pedobacter sp. BS3 TaxID=2567937 RepID=UPI0011F05E28|nr:hypothetical protein [Pedobacter sp. BS3]TZF84845.1 hypothetical protein FW774_07665 [Pedobacter sp. BS3]
MPQHPGILSLALHKRVDHIVGSVMARFSDGVHTFTLYFNKLAEIIQGKFQQISSPNIIFEFPFFFLPLNHQMI